MRLKVVSKLPYLFQSLEFDNLLHRAEDLFSSDAHVVVDVGENGRLHEETLVTQTATTAQKLRTLLLSAVDQFQDLVELLRIDLKPNKNEPPSRHGS